MFRQTDRQVDIMEWRCGRGVFKAQLYKMTKTRRGGHSVAVNSKQLEPGSEKERAPTLVTWSHQKFVRGKRKGSGGEVGLEYSKDFLGAFCLLSTLLSQFHRSEP